MYRLYDYECQKCGHTAEHYQWIDSDTQMPCTDDVSICPEDGEVLKQMPPIFRINVGPPTDYFDENLQTYIRTNTHRKQVMEEQGVTEKGATPKPGW